MRWKKKRKNAREKLEKRGKKEMKDEWRERIKENKTGIISREAANRKKERNEKLVKITEEMKDED